MAIKEFYIPRQYLFGNYDTEQEDNIGKYFLFSNLQDEKEKPELVGTYDNHKNVIVVGTGDFKEFCEVYKLNPVSFPSIAFQRAYGSLLLLGKEERSDIIPPWNLCLPRDTFKKELRSFVSSIKHQLHSLVHDDGAYFYNVYKKHDVVFDSLQPAKVCPQTFVKALASPSVASKDILATFAPQESLNGYTKAVSYLRNDSATGRLKIKDDSPNILTLSKELRGSILESRFGKDNGSIYYLDFKSLEPRVLLSVIENITLNTSFNSSLLYKVPFLKSDSLDIYQEVLNNLGISGLSRNAIKLVLLMVIYGAKELAVVEKLQEQEKIEDVSIAKKIYKYVHEAFGIEIIKEKYLTPDSKTHRIYNYYGRPILVDGVEEYKFINYFIQSTAVDVALFGFANIVHKLIETNTIDKIVPMFILHDALILDVHNDYAYALPKLASYAGKKGNIQGFENNVFPIDVSKI